jgi:hypothetical protein
MRRRPNSTGTLAATVIAGFCAPQGHIQDVLSSMREIQQMA